MSLACGGRGPCCHVGYAHRHCEHCDVVIPIQHFHGYPWYQPYWGNFGIGYSTLGGQLQSFMSSATPLPPGSSTEVHIDHAG